MDAQELLVARVHQVVDAQLHREVPHLLGRQVGAHARVRVPQHQLASLWQWDAGVGVEKVEHGAGVVRGDVGPLAGALIGRVGGGLLVAQRQPEAQRHLRAVPHREVLHLGRSDDDAVKGELVLINVEQRDAVTGREDEDDGWRGRWLLLRRRRWRLL